MSQTQLEGPVRVRFAPSPTGFLHVGGARTAIYNDLLRQSLGGAFILRIEDTDRERSDEAMTQQIQSALAWLGVAWDEGPHLQSAGLARHRERAEQLVGAGKAYRCYRSKEELDALRQAAEKGGGAFRYREKLHRLSREEEDHRATVGEPYVIRFRMPEGKIRFHDLVRGDMEFPPDALDDFILLRSDGSPTYHLSVVVDDIDMRVTHILRGEDHLSNTPKHVPLFEALIELDGEGRLPVFGHLPLILGPDKKRLSKRVGSTSVEEFRAEGILPQAMYNFLALLGWSPGEDREILSRQEMVELFSVDRLNASAAVFDRDKLGWMNARYLANLPLSELMPHLEPFLLEVGLGEGVDRPRLEQAAELHRIRANDLRDLAAQLTPYFAEQLEYDPEVCAPFLADPDLPARLHRLRERYAVVEPFEVGSLEQELRSLADELGIKAGALIHPLRMALSGSKAGPGVFDLVALQGRKATVRHLEVFLGFLAEEGVTAPQAPAAP